MSFMTALAEDRRLCILHLLAGSPGRETNHFVLKTTLLSLGHRATHDMVKGDIAWLDSMRLVVMSTSEKGDVISAKLTSYGKDVADGNVSVPGVKFPSE